MRQAPQYSGYRRQICAAVGKKEEKGREKEERKKKRRRRKERKKEEEGKRKKKRKEAKRKRGKITCPLPEKKDKLSGHASAICAPGLPSGKMKG